MGEKLAETWLDHLEQIKDAKRRVERYHRARSGDMDIQRVVEREIAGEIRSELNEIQGKIKAKWIAEFYTYTLDDCDGINITELERKVMAEWLKSKSFAEVDRRLYLAPQTAFNTFNRVINKIKLGPKHESLSEQQQRIMALKDRGFKLKEIAEDLDIPLGSVKKQLNRIKKKQLN